MTEERPQAAPSNDAPPERPAKPQRRYTGRKKICRLCNKVRCSPGEAVIDYKDVGRLRMLVSDRGKIEPRRKTRPTWASKERRLESKKRRSGVKGMRQRKPAFD